MEFLGIEELMRYLKRRYDATERKSEWRALTGRDHVSGVYDTFVFSGDAVHQIKAVEVAPQRMIAVGGEVGSGSPDLAEIVRKGSPVPIGVVSHAPDASSIIMFGMQQYSSDVAYTLRSEYFQSKQDRLDSDLQRRLDIVLKRPEFRTAYRKLREDQESYFS
ncbi:MAG: hypothetical protein JSU93_01425 [Methanobacteriota archaeon]|nr:MAG: hypothetical protein JSU93_01425 [Euryarchaeota archaeon]